MSLCSLCCSNRSVKEFSVSPAFNAVPLCIDASDFEVWFPICATESRTVRFIGTNTNSQGLFIGQTTGQVFRYFGKIQPVLGQPIGTLLRQSFSESNSVFRLPSDQTGVASSSLRLGVLIVSVFIIEPERKFESLNQGVLPCRSLCLWISISMCLNPSSSSKHSKSTCTAILTS